MNDAGLKLIHLRDIVHIIRQIVRLFDEAVSTVDLDVPKGTSFQERKRQLTLKRRLLGKQLKGLLDRVFDAFRMGNESVCVLRLLGLIGELKDKRQVIQTSSVKKLANRLERFLKTWRDIGYTSGDIEFIKRMQRFFNREAEQFVFGLGEIPVFVVDHLYDLVEAIGHAVTQHELADVVHQSGEEGLLQQGGLAILDHQPASKSEPMECSQSSLSFNPVRVALVL